MRASRKWPIINLFMGVVCLASLLGCTGEAARQVVVYTAHDEIFSRPILDRFEEQSGIEVLAVYDTEASKTTGLVNRLLAESDRPRADVFWNNEVAQTIRLKQEGMLQPYESPQREAFPAVFRDPEGYWTGFGARARVLIYNTNLINEPPTGIMDLLDPKWRGRVCIARPLFGTTATHGAALFALWGADEAKDFFEALLQNDVAILPGNSTVRDLVARGEYAFGLTDTDDANGAVLDGFPVEWVFPDQAEDGLGTLLIPNTVALIDGAPHPDEARQLIDFLLSAETEEALAQSRALQIPLHKDAQAPQNVPKIDQIRTMDVTFAEIAAAMPESTTFFETSFVQ